MATITISKNLIKEKDLILVPRRKYEELLHIVKLMPKNQQWFWTKEWQEKEREAEKDIGAGRVNGPFTSGKALVKSLKSKR